MYGATAPDMTIYRTMVRRRPLGTSDLRGVDDPMVWPRRPQLLNLSSPLVIVDDNLAEAELRVEASSLRARARHLNDTSKACLFASSYCLFTFTMGPPSDVSSSTPIPFKPPPSSWH